MIGFVCELIRSFHCLDHVRIGILVGRLIGRLVGRLVGRLIRRVGQLLAWFDNARRNDRDRLDSVCANVASTTYHWELSTEDAFEGMGWQQVEDATKALAMVTVGSFVGEPATGHPINVHYRLYEAYNEKHGCVVVVNGFTEAVAMYQEVVYDFVRNGFSVYAYDHRGQGFSSRLIDGDAHVDKGHIDTFDHLVSDLARFVALVRNRRASRPATMHVLANSMGGTVASLYLSRVQSPSASVAMLAPMHQIKLTPLVSLLLSSRILRLFLPFACCVRIYGRDFSSAEAAFLSTTALSDDDMSHSMRRLRRRWAARRAKWTDALGELHDARISGVTLRWLVDAHDAARRSRCPASCARQVRTLVLQAENDSVVDANGQYAYCKHLNAATAGSCRMQRVVNARHLILHEADAYRNPALGSIMSFFASNETP